MTEKLLTVVTPFYNSMEFIDKPIRSMLCQTYQNWEYICVDDCSTDRTLEKLREYAAKDPRIKVIAREKNSGSAAGGFNAGILAAKGTYIQLLGHDDELSPDLLENIAKRIDETNADVIIPDARIVGKGVSEDLETFDMIGITPSNKGKDDFKTKDRSIILSGREAFVLSLNWRIHGWACFSTNLIGKCDKLNEGVMNPDELWTRELFLNAEKVAFCEGQYVYLRRKDSISNKMNAKSFDVFKVQQKLLELLKSHKFGRKELKIWKENTLFRLQSHSYRYLFNQHLFSAEERKKAKDILKQAWKMAFRECWYNLKFYLTLLKINNNVRRYKKYCCLKKKLQKKGMID
ncbi:MAG: glycosyltransferase family 2 protein [Alphaproteobacteria bacterium]|nr:glycosyltransferase family 2 protein [Alphaproteobacteria bacterium]